MVKLVAPWWSHHKAIVAAQYWADEIYVWVPFTSLRMRQNKIHWFEELKTTIQDIHWLGKRALLTMNIFPRNNDIKIFESAVEKISDVGADAIIFSDPWTFKIIRKYLPNTDLHLSTQTSTMNYGAVQFRYDLWVKRIVLARELHIDEIKDIKTKVPNMELEVFVHWAMCMSYSGRCLLGDYMSGRPGNKWECSHACRFKYKVRLEEERRPGKLFQLQWDESGTHIMSSKDLCVIDNLAQILPYVDALKIEWRSKSQFYVWSIVKSYRHAIDCILQNQKSDPNIINLVNVVPHRQYRNGFLLNKMQDYPEGEEISEDKIQRISDDLIQKKTEDDITFDIIWSAMHVHNELWPALLEKTYKKWLKHELEKKWYKVNEETKIDYKIDNNIVWKWYIDLIINDVVALELKSTKFTKWDYYKQLRSYIQKNDTIKVWLLLNFYNKKLDYKRLDKWFQYNNSTSSAQIVWHHQHKSSDIISTNRLTSTTLDSAGPLFNRNYFGTFTDQFIEYNWKKYFQIDPKEVITRWMKIKFISPDAMWELTIIDILNSKWKELGKATCNTPDIYILTDQQLSGREILYE